MEFAFGGPCGYSREGLGVDHVGACGSVGRCDVVQGEVDGLGEWDGRVGWEEVGGASSEARRMGLDGGLDRVGGAKEDD